MEMESYEVELTSLMSEDPSNANNRRKSKSGGFGTLSPPQTYVNKWVVFMGVMSLTVALSTMTLFTVIGGNSKTGQGPTEISHQANVHSSSFGGVNNVAHPGGAKAAASGEGLAFEKDIFIPVSNLGHAVKSLNKQNILNQLGHYLHDEHRSPYSSHLYDQSKEFLDQQQDKFIAQMKAVREEWGAWNFNEQAEFTDCSNVDYGDMPNSQFPPGAWQMDENYVSKFIPEAKRLVARVTEGIYAEYGSPYQNEMKTPSAKELEDRDEKWKIHIVKDGEDFPSGKGAFPKTGLVVLTQAAFDGLVRKLLHAMITNDHFFAVLGGHSAAAGHGNNFQQNRMISFHKLMEPVFDKLGVHLISRNMAMGGVGTLQMSLAGADIYGEADIMEWDSGMTEKGAPTDFFNKQAILTGERVPLLLHAQPRHEFNIVEETNGTAWWGAYLDDLTMIPETVDLVQAQTLPYAARFMNGFQSKEDKFNAVCWEERSDVKPHVKQDSKPGGQASWHPGNRVHQWQGRKLALIVLKGLTAALEQWEQGILAGFPLGETYWHVGGAYQGIREKLRTHITTPKKTAEGIDVAAVDDVRSPCETMIPWLPRICRVAMHGYGMWLPRAHEDYDLLNIIQPAMNGYVPSLPVNELYNGFDVLPFSQAIPDGDVDVHAIAIATTEAPPDINHSWNEDDPEGEGEDSTINATGTGKNITGSDTSAPNRRWLKEASNIGFKAGSGAGTALTSVSQQKYHPLSSVAGQQKQKQEQPEKNSIIRKRNLGDEDDKIVPGLGWGTAGWSVTQAFCDGSAMSTCGRIKDTEKCLLRGSVDNHLDVTGNAFSGWLVLRVPNVKEGIIIARLEWWCGVKSPLTVSWTEVNGGKTMDTTPYNATRPTTRQLGNAAFDNLVPMDFEMDIAINGKITRTMKREEWLTYTHEYTKNCAVWPLFDDEDMARRDWKKGEEGETVEVAIRFRSQSKPLDSNMCLSHVYYA